ncbi:winged helix-turn-helix transcriptional regulator [bacterium]|nr:winged helix-turn-helix transcriptional regulator [bacterium]
MKTLVSCLKALADKNRLRIIKLLQHKKMCVCELADIIGISQPSLSRHLNKLKSAGLIGSEQDGFWTNYFLKNTNNIYGKILITIIKDWLNDDECIKEDFHKAQYTDRNKLCK